MADTLALEKLFDDVEQRFVAEGTNIPNVFGWDKPNHRGGGQNRICWVPGDPSGALGAVGSARYPGGNPRSIGTLEEIFTVYIEARDTSGLENERLQYKAARFAFDAWYRAALLSVNNLFKVKSSAWMVERKTRRHGATIQAVCTVQAMIPDAAYAVPEDVEAVVDMELDGDNNETTPNASEAMDIPPLEES